MPTSLLEAAAWQLAVVATCRKCRAEGVFDPHALWWLFDRNLSGYEFDSASPPPPLRGLLRSRLAPLGSEKLGHAARAQQSAPPRMKRHALRRN